jgi:hypothetical protein
MVTTRCFYPLELFNSNRSLAAVLFAIGLIIGCRCDRVNNEYTHTRARVRACAGDADGGAIAAAADAAVAWQTSAAAKSPAVHAD